MLTVIHILQLCSVPLTRIKSLASLAYVFTRQRQFQVHPIGIFNNIENTLYPQIKLHLMDISLIPIGNSEGIRLTKMLIEKYNIKHTIELMLEKDYMILKPKATSRISWYTSFNKSTIMAMIYFLYPT